MRQKLEIVHNAMNVWVVICDQTEATVYLYKRVARQIPLCGTTHRTYFENRIGHTLVPIPGGYLKAPTLDDYEIGRDQRGTSLSDANAERNYFEPHGNLKQELKHRFVKNIAHWLAAARSDNKFDQLVIAAPAKIVGELRKQLPAELQDRIAAVLPKDLAGFDANDILLHLQDTLNEVHAV